MSDNPYHVLIRNGDATGEIESLLARLGSPDRAGLHRFFYVSRADQTVVMLLDGESPLAVALRGRPGWSEPKDPD